MHNTKGYVKSRAIPDSIELKELLEEAATLEDSDLDEPEACRALLLAVLRRAAHDWVLYKNSTKLANKLLADEVYDWLFVEQEGTESWEERQQEDKGFTSFLSICETLDLDPEEVRNAVRSMTVAGILGAGRPVERRRVSEASVDCGYRSSSLEDSTCLEGFMQGSRGTSESEGPQRSLKYGFCFYNERSKL